MFPLFYRTVRQKPRTVVTLNMIQYLFESVQDEFIATYTQTLNQVNVFLPQMVAVASDVSCAVVSDGIFMIWIHMMRKRIPVAQSFS